MGLDKDDREDLESAIIDASYAAERYIETEKEIHKKLLQISVGEAMDMFEEHQEYLCGDKLSEAYKLHMFVPLQLVKLIENKEENG